MGNKKQNVAPVSNDSGKKGVDKKINGTRLFLLIFAAVALVAIITAIIFAVVQNANNKLVDFENDDLSKYVSLSRDDYKSFDVTVNVDPVTDNAVENKIIQLLYKNRKDSEDMRFKQGETIRVGDTANIYYYGYTLDSDGNKVPFTGGCNFGSEKSTALGIGSGSFVEGFELGLIGKNQNDYATVTKSSATKATAEDTVFITYTAIYSDGTYEKDATALIDLTDEGIEEEWGEGFGLYLCSATVGTKVSKEFKRTYTDENGKTKSDIIYDVTVNAIVELGEGEPLTVEAYFPVGYTNTALAGKTAYFDVYIMTTQLYDTPEFNDEFVTGTLKYTAEELAEYEGETLADKYRSMIRAGLERDYGYAVDNAIESALWDVLMDKAEFKRLPENEVMAYYNGYVAEVESYYNYYAGTSQSTDLDTVACSYLQLDKGTDWRAYLRESAEESISQKLVFYYLLQLENIHPTDEEKQEMYDVLVDYYLEQYLVNYKVERSNYKTLEEYQHAVDGYRSTVLGNYGEDYFRENALFLAALEHLKQYANLIYVNN